jgi:hypothetical protein
VNERNATVACVFKSEPSNTETRLCTIGQEARERRERLKARWERNNEKQASLHEWSRQEDGQAAPHQDASEQAQDALQTGVALDTVALNPPRPRQPEGTTHQPGTLHVDDGHGEIAMEESAVESPSGDPVAAELVDLDVERQIVESKVRIGIARERENVPFAEVVHERFCCQRRTIIAMLVLALLAILAILLGVLIERDPPPQPVPSEDEIVAVLSAVSLDGGAAFQEPGSPQNKAFRWLASDTFDGYHSDEKLIQRYALATLFYATNGEAWLNNSMWLDSGDECGRWWQFIGGLACDSPTGAVTALELAKNNLTGTLPPEIGLFPSLARLDLSQNHLKSTIPSEIGQLVRFSVVHGSQLQLCAFCVLRLTLFHSAALLL